MKPDKSDYFIAIFIFLAKPIIKFLAGVKNIVGGHQITNPVGKIAEKTWHCILSAELTKTHSFMNMMQYMQ